MKIFGEFLGKSIDIDLGASMGKGLMEILKGMDSVALEKLAKQYGASTRASWSKNSKAPAATNWR